jgi:hypothetical protein
MTFSKKMTESEVIEYIKDSTRPIEQIDDNFISSFKRLSNEIYEGKAPLRANSVQFIIAKILTRQGQTFDIRKKDFFIVYVIGDFKKSFTPVLRVAEAFASFYSEIGILPNIIPLPKHILKRDKELLHKIRNGALIYERR